MAKKKTTKKIIKKLKAKSIKNKKVKPNRKKSALIITEVVLIITLGSILLIKDYVSIAAILADDYLRPTLGSNVVIFIEKVFYNAADEFTQLTNHEGQSPNIDLDDKEASPRDGDLALNPIPVDPKLTPMKNEGIWLEKKLSIL